MLTLLKIAFFFFLLRKKKIQISQPVRMSSKPAVLQLLLQSFFALCENILATLTVLLDKSGAYLSNTFSTRPPCESASVAKLCFHIWLHKHLVCW